MGLSDTNKLFEYGFVRFQVTRVKNNDLKVCWENRFGGLFFVDKTKK